MSPALKALYKILKSFGLDVDKIPKGSDVEVLRHIEQYGNEEVDRYRQLAAYLRDEEPEQWPNSEVTPVVVPED